ncbi:MAG: hypothetical protein LBJ63_01380 [Prevotellaceae bacterium]|jgi:hypothetical protein|nr:hypothetical protein [Prevotellaceae bacterium]
MKMKFLFILLSPFLLLGCSNVSAQSAKANTAFEYFQKNEGVYPDDLLTNKVLSTRLKALVGMENYAFMQDHEQIASPIEAGEVAHNLYYTASAFQQGNPENGFSISCFDDDDLSVEITRNGKTKSFMEGVKQYLFSGTIGKYKVGKMQLNIYSNGNVTGEYSYANHPENSMQLSGHLDGQNLQMTGYSNEYTETETFNGTFSANNYSGIWRMIDGSKSLEFNMTGNNSVQAVKESNLAPAPALVPVPAPAPVSVPAQTATPQGNEVDTAPDYSTLLWILGIGALILFLWLAAKSKRGEIIIYKSWGDAIITCLVGILAVFIPAKLELNPIFLYIIIALTFVWSIWISIKRNNNAGIVMGIVIGITRMLIVYLLIALAAIAWSAAQGKKEKMEQASHMRRSSERATKAKNDKIKEAEQDGMIAAVAIVVLTWLSISFIHSKNEHDSKVVENELKKHLN